MVDPANRALIDRYFAGECTPEEAERVREVLAAHLDEHAAIELAIAHLDADTPAPPRSAKQSLRILRARLADAANRPRVFQLAHAVARPRRRLAGWAIAATLAVAAGATLVWHGTHLAAHQRATAPQQFKTFATVGGQRATVELSDGTRVMLAPESHLRVPVDYGIDMRSVWLDGDAYFDVYHDPQHPFSVRAGAAVAEDIGTKFDVRAYAGEGANGEGLGHGTGVRIAVVEGAVAVRGETHATSVTDVRAGEVAAVDAAGRVRAIEVGTASQYMVWTEGRLVFQGEPMRAVAAEVSRWYGVDVSVADSALGRRRITTSFTTEPVADVVRALADALEANVEQRGSAIVFVPRTGWHSERPRS